METFLAHGGLFLAALASATVLPLQSEVVLVGLLLSERHGWPWLVLVASVGNTLGSVINWLLGRWIERHRGRRWFPVSDGMLDRAQGWYRRYGRWSLLMSWAPFVGDPLTIVAGVMREPLGMFVLLVALAKTTRYLAVVALTSGWL